MRRSWGVALIVLGLLALYAVPARGASDSDALMATVEAYSGLAPNHLTGTANEARTQQWLTSQLQAAGATTGADAYRFFGFHPTAASLLVSTVTPHLFTNVAPYLYSGVTGPAGVTGRLVDAGKGTEAEVARLKMHGRIAVVDVPTFDGLSPTLASAFSTIKQGGALALVIVTDGPADLPVNQDVDSRGGLQGLPTLLIGHESGAAVIGDTQSGIQATLTLTANVGAACDTDVWGVLPGRDPSRYIIVGTPTSGFDPAASERGAGVAILIALARHYGALPIGQRPVGLIFAGLSGHEVGYLGLPILIETHPDWFSMADAYVHLGASIAAVLGGAPDPTRALYVSENPVLESGVLGAFGAMPQLPPSVEDPGEQRVAYAAGIPVVAESGSSYWFHTSGDDPAGVGPELLASQAQAFASTVDAIAGTSPLVIRRANVVADGLRSSPAAPGSHEPVPVASCGNPTALAPPPTTADGTGTSVALGLVPGYELAQPGYAWEGHWQEQHVALTSAATGASLSAEVFAPNPPPAHPVPGVVIVPGSGPGVQTFYQWAARDLAGHGYVAVTVDPQGVGQSATFGSPACGLGMTTLCPGVPSQQDGNYVDAVETGVNFLVSSADPYRPWLDVAAIGVAGHSLAARAVSYAQGGDRRIGAVVAWDNLASDLNGDAGSASGGPPLGNLIGGELPGAPTPVTPRVPALGEASDSVGTANPGDTSPDLKKTAYADWVAHHVAAMEVVFAGAAHVDWAQTMTNTTTDELSLARFEYYTRAWFDLWLRHDPSAVGRLTASTVLGAPRADIMSTKFRSAISLPGLAPCNDLRAGCG